MALFSLGDRTPKIDESSYIAESATVIGNVHIGKKVWVGPGATLRGDYGEIFVGDFTAIEENCVLHARPGERCEIGDHVTIGHGSIIHTGKVGNWAVIGMGAIVSDFAEVGKWSAVGEGAVVKNKDHIPDEAIAVGLPAKVIGKVSEEYKRLWTEYKERYNNFASEYKEIKKLS